MTYMGGAPSIPTVNPQKVVNAILQGYKKELPLLGGFLQQPDIAAAQKTADYIPGIAGQISGQLPGLVSGLQGVLKNLPSVSGLTAPLQSALTRDAGIVATEGAITPGQAASLNAPIAAELGQAGMGHTLPGVVTQAMNTFQAEQDRVNTAISQELQLAPGIESLRAQDVGLRSALPQMIQRLETGAVQGLGAAEQGQMMPLQAGVQDFTQLVGALSGPISSQILANQQAQAASATAGANKSAGLGSGALSSVGEVASALGMAAMLA